MRRIAVLLFVLVSFVPICAKAHAGKTDENGGHYDKSTGEYHYHHGYPAHQHYDIDGDGKADCPYDFDDRTGWNSGSSSGSGYYSSNQFSDSYLDGYNKGREAGYHDGYEDGESAESAKTFYACVGVCAGTVTIASLSGRKRRKEDATKVDEAKKELNAKSREISELKDQKEKTRETISNLEANIAASKKEITRLQSVFTKGINQSLHQKLTEMYGTDYISALSGSPKGDFVDDGGMPHGKTFTHFKPTDKYVFYLGGNSGRSTNTYHTKFCHHANMNLPVNAYVLSKAGSYNRCLQCSPKLPDVSWVERYKVYKSILKDIDIAEEDVNPGQDAADQSSQAAPLSPHD